MQRCVCFLCVLALVLAACSGRYEPRSTPAAGSSHAENHQMEGVASWYGGKFQGRRTADGEVYDMHLLTAAHRTLPFHTLVRVTRLDSGRSVTVRINDRGPFVAGRIIDLSYAAARRLGMAEEGTAPVRLEVVSTAADQPSAPAAGLQVQAGAFTLPANAAARARELQARYGLDFSVVSGDGWHRVMSPPLARPAAEELCRRLRNAGIEAFIRESL